MNSTTLTRNLKAQYGDIIFTGYATPKPKIGKEKIRAIVLGADPTHMVEGVPEEFEFVFGLERKNSAYWRGIHKNIKTIPGLDMDTIHVDNLCRNYFMEETSQNKVWKEIARCYWSPFLREELDGMYDKNIPVLITTQFILFAILKEVKMKISAKSIYEQCRAFSPDETLLHRKVFAMYRHPRYSLDKWPVYADYISKLIPE